MTTASNLGRIIGVLALAALLGACSAVKLGYNTLGEVAYWWLDGYVDLTESQAPRVREDLGRLHLWHRGTELPRVADLLQNMEKLVPADIAPAQACGFVTELRERLGAVMTQAEPAMVTLALSLEPEQLAHLERKYRRNNADYRKEWVELPPAEQREKRFKQVLDRSEMVYGTLEDRQRTTLRQQMERSVFDPARILAERQRRQQDLVQTLRKLAGQPVPLAQARQLMHGYLERAQDSPDEGYRRYQESLIEESCRMFSVAHNSTTAAQREAAARRLRAYQRDLRELAAQR